MGPETDLRAAAASMPEVTLLVLFGSLARNTPHVGSDVDLGVLLDADSLALRQRVELTLGRATRRPVDLVDLGTAPPLLRFEIARDGRLIHEGRPHAWTDFKARAMVDWWDWAPTARRMHDAALRRLRERVRHGPT